MMETQDTNEEQNSCVLILNCIINFVRNLKVRKCVLPEETRLFAKPYGWIYQLFWSYRLELLQTLRCRYIGNTTQPRLVTYYYSILFNVKGKTYVYSPIGWHLYEAKYLQSEETV